ncbi:unnamed protein product [Durusdinium trenchii]|uniref:Uncharacterized protein n=1 Tax=Durusdinium trenchii TaxID=1381693 RepID=A0ABP0PRN2_9DINO
MVKGKGKSGGKSKGSYGGYKVRTSFLKRDSPVAWRDSKGKGKGGGRLGDFMAQKFRLVLPRTVKGSFQKEHRLLKPTRRDEATTRCPPFRKSSRKGDNGGKWIWVESETPRQRKGKRRAAALTSEFWTKKVEEERVIQRYNVKQGWGLIKPDNLSALPAQVKKKIAEAEAKVEESGKEVEDVTVGLRLPDFFGTGSLYPHRHQARECAGWQIFGEAWGVLEALPLDHRGALQVSAPFCHDFFEDRGRTERAPHLLPFLKSQILEKGKATRIEVEGCDVRPQEFWWSAWEKWTEHEFAGRIQLHLQQQDLVQSAQRPAGLILAAHPEVTNGGPWLPILRHVLASRAKGGRCVFATFYRQEAEACVQICRMEKVQAEIRENPRLGGVSRDGLAGPRGPKPPVPAVSIFFLGGRKRWNGWGCK